MSCLTEHAAKYAGTKPLGNRFQYFIPKELEDLLEADLLAICRPCKRGTPFDPSARTLQNEILAGGNSVIIYKWVESAVICNPANRKHNQSGDTGWQSECLFSFLPFSTSELRGFHRRLFLAAAAFFPFTEALRVNKVTRQRGGRAFVSGSHAAFPVRDLCVAAGSGRRVQIGENEK